MSTSCAKMTINVMDTGRGTLWPCLAGVGARGTYYRTCAGSLDTGKIRRVPLEKGDLPGSGTTLVVE